MFSDYFLRLLSNFWGMHYVTHAVIVCITGYALYTTRRYFAGGVCKSKASLRGRTAIVTGANSGIGKETALDLASRGARVILACRNETKGNDASKEIRHKTGNQNVEMRRLNLASFVSIKSFAEIILAEEQRLDILINNAGVMGCPRWETEDGFEMHLGVNHLGHFLLTILLLPLLKESAPSRIINVSSMLHTRGIINYEDINLTQNYKPMPAYYQSKLANVLFTRELHKRLRGTGVTVNVVNPGPVNTNIFQYFKHTFPVLDFIITYFGFLGLFFVKNSHQGAQTSIYCAVEEDLSRTSGLLFSDCKPKEAAERARDDDSGKRLWDISCHMVGLKT